MTGIIFKPFKPIKPYFKLYDLMYCPYDISKHMHILNNYVIRDVSAIIMCYCETNNLNIYNFKYYPYDVEEHVQILSGYVMADATDIILNYCKVHNPHFFSIQVSPDTNNLIYCFRPDEI